MRIDKWGCALYWECIQWLKLQLLIACNRIKLHVFVFLPSSALWICWSIFKPKWMLHATVDSCKLQIRTVPSDHFSSRWWLWVLTEVTSTHLTQHQQPGRERWKKPSFTLFIPNISLLLLSVFSHLFPFSWPPKWLCSYCISFCHVPVPFLVFFPFSLEALILASLQDPLSSAEIQERLNNAMLAICRGLS